MILSFPGGHVDATNFRTGDAKTMTTINGVNYAVPEDDFPTRLPATHVRIVRRREAEVFFRSRGMFEWSDRIREGTDQLEKRGKLERRRGSGRDDR